MISQAEQVMDYCGSSSFWGWTLAALLPILLVVGTGTSVVTATTTSNIVNTETTAAPVGVHTGQFLVYRLHQIDLPHGAFGSRSSVFSLEPVTPGHIGESYLRKCALFRLTDLVQGHNSGGGVDVYDVFLTKVLSQALVSAVLIIFESASLKSSFTGDQLAVLQTIERKLLSNETALPIYLVEAGEEINRLYDEYASKQSGSAAATASSTGGDSPAVNIKTQPSLYDAILKNVFSDSHQLVVSGPQTSAINNPVITSIQAKFIGAGPEDQLPTYAIVAHYDSYSVVPGLAFGADSNASGLVLLLELMRLFSKLYSSTKTKPRANLLFFVAGGGKLNYFGTKRWLEEHLDAGTHAPTTTLLENLQWAACLDALAGNGNGDQQRSSLAMVVSKPPRPGTASAVFWEHLSEVAERFYPSMMTTNGEEEPTNGTTLVHKKINLADASLGWEHERFSLRRLSAFSLSSLAAAAASGSSSSSSSFSASRSLLKRQSLVDVPRLPEQLDALERHANIIGEALARQLYGGRLASSGGQYDALLKAEYAVSRAHLRALYEYYASIPRAQQTLLSTSKSGSGSGSGSSGSTSNSYNVPPLLKAIHGAMKKYSNGHIKLLHSKPDPKSPEFVFYEPITAKMDVFNMKPAAFDIVITMGILLYLAAFYLVIRNFNYFSFASRSHQENGHSSKVKTR